MEIEGKIIVVLPEQSGTSSRTGNPWKSQEYVIETHDQFPRKCCFRVFGADRIAAMNIQSGEELRVSFDVDAREYQGRWYNTLTAWRVDRIDPMAAQTGTDQQPMPISGAFPAPPPAGTAPAAPTAQQPQPFSAEQPQNNESSTVDLPF